MSFTHLHVHTHYSTLDGAAQIPDLVEKAISDGMNAMAITDHGNMYGVKDFYNYVRGGYAKVIKKQIEKAEAAGKDVTALKDKLERIKHFKPILGCEVYIAPESRFDRTEQADKPKRFHLILLAKNLTGYYNLVKLVSLGFTEGFYRKPRIDREILDKYREGLIVCTACVAGELPRLVAAGKMQEADEMIGWYKERFGDDFYIELQRHETNKPGGVKDVFEKQQIINPVLMDLAKKHGLKCIATNDVHFVNEEEAEAHDRLLCISTAKNVTDEKRLRYTKQEWFKTQAEMNAIFADVPEALANTAEIADKVELFDIDSKPVMPDFPLPEGFTDSDEYLKHLTYEGAKKRYPDMNDATRERIDFELGVIKSMGFPGYFLIVQDFIRAARDMGVSVGPGRGSAAGSVVAYCLKITDIDPIKYDLLFERFLNPDRISMPDIDIDFDDDGRAKVLQWVTNKYGKDSVAHIVTFGTMAAKSAIKDVARVQGLPISESDRLSKLIDEIPRDKKKVNIATAIETVPAMREALHSPDPLIADTIRYAQMLEGTIRQTGVHACGVVIGREDLSKYVPVAITEDKDTKEDLLVTQYEGSLIEEVGMIKMDFLGLRTLSIIKEALANIKQTTGKDLDIDTIPIDDKLTYELCSRGETTAVFQFESDGMKKYLRELQPGKFEDLIAMNALYRPGPMDYIPDFINRKLGKKPIAYDIPVMESRLKETYGITVYQEQVMLLSRDLAGFTRGESDTLRKAMGKKLRDKLDALKSKFVEGCEKNGYDKKIVEKIWADWEKFAEYAFNKSHATCYSWVAYQTAYLKAHYPAEFMAANLSRNISNITEITKFMEECRRMGIEVLGPDVNESNLTFTVNKKGNIRFGLGAVKGVGEGAVLSIVEARKQRPFKDIFDFVERVSLSSVNKRVLEALAQSGALDTLGISREPFFAETAPGETFTDAIIRFGNKMQSDKNLTQNSLWGNEQAVAITFPDIPRPEEWSILEKLNREKDLIGMYLSAHPLDPFRLEMTQLVNVKLSELASQPEGRDFVVAGLVTSAKNLIAKSGKPWGSIVLEDFNCSYEFRFFGKDHETFQNYLRDGLPLYIRGRMERNFRNEVEPKIKSITYLSNVREEIVKSVQLTLPLPLITEMWLTRFGEQLDRNKGKTMLKFHVIDPETNRHLNLFSRNTRVNLNREMLDFLDEEGLEYRIGA